jgi:hypothetical protein
MKTFRVGPLGVVSHEEYFGDVDLEQKIRRRHSHGLKYFSDKMCRVTS